MKSAKSVTVQNVPNEHAFGTFWTVSTAAWKPETLSSTVQNVPNECAFGTFWTVSKVDFCAFAQKFPPHFCENHFQMPS